jgi:predicted P-loop ATPase
MRATATDGIEGLAGYRPRSEAPWRKGLIRNAQGAPKALLANVITALRTAPEWEQRLSFNALSLTTELSAPPPWEAGSNVPWKPRPWTPRDDVLAADWLQHSRIGVGVEVTQAAVEAVAQDHTFHPVQDYLNGLLWDGQERIGQWLTIYLGAERSAYVDAVGQRFLISAVARALQPGCKADHTLVLEGRQGIGKSTGCKALASPWYTDELADLGSREASLQVQGVWIVEISELDAMSRAEVSRIKAFLSRTTDRYRPPYGRRVVEVPRQCVFIATTNSDGYLKDETGGRRFWPVAVRRVDVDGLKRDRDQLWAEAVHRYRRGAPWWIDSSTLASDAAGEQATRYAGDPWHEAVSAFVGERKSVSLTEVLKDGLEIDRSRWTQVEQNRVARILKTLGYHRKQIRCGEARFWQYVKKAEG